MRNLKKIAIIVMLLIPFRGKLQAQSKNDSLAVIKCIKTYAEACFAGDVPPIDKTVNADFKKHLVHINADSEGSILQTESKSQLLAYTKAGIGKQNSAEKTKLSIKVYEIYTNFATAKLSTVDFYNYILLVKFNGEWQIVNIVQDNKTNPNIANKQYLRDSIEIVSTIKNYIDGWFTGNPDRMDKALHPDLSKHTVETLKETGSSILETLTRTQMHEYTRSAWGKTAPKEKKVLKFQIYEISENFATAKSIALDDFFDYIHFVKFNDEWKIINVVYGHFIEKK